MRHPMDGRHASRPRLADAALKLVTVGDKLLGATFVSHNLPSGVLEGVAVTD